MGFDANYVSFGIKEYHLSHNKLRKSLEREYEGGGCRCLKM